MVDVPLMRAQLRALPEQAALLHVGDVDQLPSDAPGQVLAEKRGPPRAKKTRQLIEDLGSQSRLTFPARSPAPMTRIYLQISFIRLSRGDIGLA